MNQIFRHPFAGGAQCRYDNGEIRKRSVEVERVAQEMKNDGVTIFAFGIDEHHNIDFDHLENVASPDDVKHLFQIEDIDEFTELIIELQDHLTIAQEHDDTIDCLPLSFKK
uniref:VWFA domain-containing protein n=1 Tax=Branchiostoma floridae TaxID=7739 RepID=C3Y9E7_BRAFL|eukprot:XP_002607193.1 hypothetical protein BRAFLDRAFT_68010 [Branchiostoma floridae]